MDPAADALAASVSASDSLSVTPTSRHVQSSNRSRDNGLEPDYSEEDDTSQIDPSADHLSDALHESKPNKYQTGWRRVVRNFSPSWFSVTLGTGIVSLILNDIPFETTWLYWISVAFLILNTILFVMAFVASFLRYSLYPEIWKVMLSDPYNSLFLGTIPMGFALLIQSWLVLCCPYWGVWAAYVAWGAWMLDAIASLTITAGLSYILISQSEINSLERITAAQLLPISATIVAAGAGVQVAVVLRSQEQAIATLLVSYVLWGMATPLSLIVLAIYYSRLILHKLPPREVIVSSFLPLGPLGSGGYAILHLGKVARDVLPRVELLSHVSIAGDVLYLSGLLTALVMWAFGLTWLILALLTIWSSRPFPFNMGWWGFTFPLGVFAISTITIGNELPSLFFQILGTIFGVAVVLLWIVVAAGTIRGAWNGKLFYAPCLKRLPIHQQIGIKLADAKNVAPERMA